MLTEKKALKLQAALPQIAGYDRDCNAAQITVRSWVRVTKRDGKLFAHISVSAEEGDGAANYYGPKGYQVIAPELEQWATDNGGHWEWQDPGSINFYID